MRNKNTVDLKVDNAKNLIESLYNDIENNKQYITKEYILEKLSIIKYNIDLVSNYLDLED